jgi:hypothetical protein
MTPHFSICCYLLFYCLSFGTVARAQSLLQKTVHIDVRNKRLADVLTTIGKQGNFYFSYNSNILRKDSLVNVLAKGKTVKQVLVSLLGNSYQYSETDKYIIIHTDDREKSYCISGYITDGTTGGPLEDASVFERNQLASAITGKDGYFRLHLKDKGRYPTAEITITKGFYTDTNISLIKGFDQELALNLIPQTYSLPDMVITQHSKMERTWLGRLLVSSKLRTQNLNLGKFFVDKPYQFSLIPGVGTHGKMTGQVDNDFSFNLLGGYTAGVKGFEMGGIFNINKKDAEYVQVAGMFNVVAGSSKGVQLGGFSNYVEKNVQGVQASGFLNKAGSVQGAQLAGFFNAAFDSLEGAQVAGFINIAESANVQTAGFINVAQHISGIQIAGFINVAEEVNGMQLAGFINVAGKVKGVQMAGFINVADSSDYPIGIINIIEKGDVSIGTTIDEMGITMAALRSGGKVLYGLVGIGRTGLVPAPGVAGTPDMYAIEAGLGAHINFTKHFRIHTEIASMSLADFAGNSFHDNAMRIMPAVRLGRIEVFAGAGLNYAFYTLRPQNIAMDGNILWSGNTLAGLSEWRIGYRAGLQFKI